MMTTGSTSTGRLINDTQPEEFDLVILGGGTGSTVAAWTFAGEGKRVAVIDRKYIGGSCPNIACLPSKNIIHSCHQREGSPAVRAGALSNGLLSSDRHFLQTPAQHRAYDPPSHFGLTYCYAVQRIFLSTL
jgi:choline dehydrogenase-like flavoprotein